MTFRSRNSPSICIISHNGYGAISGGGHGFVGGVERQTSLLARWLAGRDYTVTFLTWDEGGSPEEVIDGVRILKVCRKDAGLPGLRFIHPRLTGLNAALSKANADVYYHNCSESITGQIALWCRRHHKRFVFSLASDADWDPKLPEIGRWYEKALYRYGVRNADTVIAQTETQRSMLRKFWNVDASWVPMPCEAPATGEPANAGRAAGRILWVGRVCSVKRVEWFLDVAEALPQYKFDLVGPFYNEDYANGILSRASSISNITIHGRIEKAQIGRFYRQASLLLCTSIYEGFPNTFLEAWSRSVPLITTFDPDGVTVRNRLGFHVSDVGSARNAVLECLESEKLYQEFSNNGKAYFEDRHELGRAMPKMERLLFEVPGK